MSLDLLHERFLSAVPKDFWTEIQNNQSLHIQKCNGSAIPLFISEIYSRVKKPLVVITPQHELAQFVRDDLETFGANAILFSPTFHSAYDDEQMQDSSAIIARSEALEDILETKCPLVVASAEAIFDRIPAPELFRDSSLMFKVNQKISPEELSEILVDRGYRTVGFVDEPGEFASRGGILDVYPLTGEYPIRFEFFGDEIDSIREFDPDSQRSVAKLSEARLIPNLEFLGGGQKQHLLEYFSENTQVVLIQPDHIAAELEQLWENASEKFGEHDESREIKDPDQLFLSPDLFTASIEAFPSIAFDNKAIESEAKHGYIVETKPPPEVNGSIKLLREYITRFSSEAKLSVILCDNEGQKDRFEELLGEAGDEFNYTLKLATIYQGFELPQQDLVVFTDHQIFRRYLRPKARKRRKRGGISFKELKDLNVGDHVVHIDYGIGKFEGFRNINVRGTIQESVQLRYKDGSTLFVNVSNLHKLQKYSGKDGAQPSLTKLGTGEWQKKKARTKGKLKDIARELIQLYAKRKAQKAYAFKPDTGWQIELEASFQYEETEDQMTAIQDVKKDMEHDMPMDRLVCGDVGFGKTEVAIRAAFKAVMDGKQVAVLVPTTILADQHFKTFSGRMKDFPVKIEVMSRFRSTAELKSIGKRLESGDTDIVIGTHRLLSKDVKFKDLRLLIIDEEQRFGVSAKDKLKQFRASVDVLTLTATPIPRTLNLSLMGARDLSTITTPPPNRQPVQTEIHSFDSKLVREAILQEVNRGGQVFFIHNRVKNIQEVAEMLRDIVPDVRIQVAHGQMSGKQLEKIIADFYHHNFDVLLSTNIVENGIDISNANTIIINHADKFGLAELHQLRGRVGRSNRKAYCYLLTAPLKELSSDARKRLLAIEEFSDIGAGINIAMRDLDIRGAGDMLGGEQSGFINDIGFDLYTKILDEAVKELKSTEFSDIFEKETDQLELPETNVEFDATAILDKEYVADNVERLNLYRKLAQASSQNAVDDWVNEVEDRFGALPENGRTLVLAARVKLESAPLLFHKVTIRAGKMWLQAPPSKSALGEKYYELGLLQHMLELLDCIEGHSYKLSQKDDAVRFIIDNISGLESAYQFLKHLKVNEPVNA